jgi:hypothetical protein
VLNENDEVEITPLTKEECKWLNGLEKYFAKCPSDRFGCFTRGHRELYFFDKDLVDAEDRNGDWLKQLGGEFGDLVESSGSFIYIIDTPFPIEGMGG